MTKPRAIGYLRRDVSGSRQKLDETQIRSLAARFGYDLCKTLVFGQDTERPIHRLCVAVDRSAAEAVFTPSTGHFEYWQVPAELVRIVDVVTVNDEHTYARYPDGRLPRLGGPRCTECDCTS